jgi:flagellum-specific ATP synthase
MILDRYIERVERMESWRWGGAVTQLIGLLVESKGPSAAIGDFLEVTSSAGRIIRTQVIGFREGRVLSMPLEETDGLQPGDMIVSRREDALVEVGPQLLGRVVDGFGRPLDSLGPLHGDDRYELYRVPPGPLEREPISEPLVTGIRAIDSLLTCGKGQRIGIFGGSGVGKSTLLGSMCRHNSADVSVIALIGERNREVRDFIEQELSAEGLKRSVVVVATSDRPSPLRIRAAFVSLAIAEYFRDQGASVLLVMDSVTRLAMAQREIGLAAGEPPSQKGYTPSVFNMLPRIFERAGRFRKGSITGFFTVLVEGDDFNEPICDATRAILDGHIILSRRLAAAGHYPAIDIMHSISRLSSALASEEHLSAARTVREALTLYDESRDLIELGAYAAGTNPGLDAAIRMRPEITGFLRQDTAVRSSIADSVAWMRRIAEKL